MLALFGCQPQPISLEAERNFLRRAGLPQELSEGPNGSGLYSRGDWHPIKARILGAATARTGPQLRTIHRTTQVRPGNKTL